MKKIPALELSECVLCGICEEIAPEVFSINELGFVSMAELDVYPESKVDEIIKNCPASCVSWINTDSADRKAS